MVKDEKLRFCMSLFGFITFLSFALPVLSESSKNSWTSCIDGYGLNYTLPMLERCKVKPDRKGNMVQTIPKVILFPPVVAGCHRRKSRGDIPAEHRICRIPDCGKNLCKNGWCEETFTAFKCHCSSGFQGEHCDEESPETSSREVTAKPTTSPTMMSEQPVTTSLQKTTTTTTTKSACTSPFKVLNGGSIYYFSTSEMDHASALSCCSEHDYHLVYIETEEEQDFIENQVQALGSGVDYWIGLKGQSHADARWLDGSQLTYDKLKQTSFGDGGGCFRIKPSDYYKWHDHPYLFQNGYICEKEIDD